jgi:hypothetical protein
MTCRSCESKNQAEFGAEINIHLRKELNKNAVFVFPTLVVCLDCGVAEFNIPEPELHLLGERGASTAA